MSEENEHRGDDWEIERYRILKSYKELLADRGNESPFAHGRVVRYDSDVSDVHVDDVHTEVRSQLCDTIRMIAAGGESQVAVLSGHPGMGKTHLVNTFRRSSEAEQLRFVLVCNSNHWRAEEFEECLLDWILDALLRPTGNVVGPDSTSEQGAQSHLLLEKVRFLAYALLDQILANPRGLSRYRATPTKYTLPLIDRLFGSKDGKIRRLAALRDDAVFSLLEFSRFAEEFGNRFLADSRNPFHRYVIGVLLRYLFPADRDSVIGWLRRKPVPDAFYKNLNWLERIDRHFKYIDVVKILISLFTPGATASFDKENAVNVSGESRVFLLAFDQIEGRDELFHNDGDWTKFFAQLSELYNALPNVFILFTMTSTNREKLLPVMEKQFRDRIARDRKFVLEYLSPEQVLSVYESRLKRWHGGIIGLPKVSDENLACLPFRNIDHLLEQSGHKFNTLRDTLKQMKAFVASSTA